MMKKIFSLFLVISLFLVTTFPIVKVEAASSTLKDYKNQLAKLESQKEENNRLTKENQNAIDAKRNAIVRANQTIVDNEKKVESSKTLVSESQENIKIKSEELKDIINILQYSKINSDEAYLDYVFDSSTISELMERQAIIDQVIEYTQQQLDDLDSLIKKNEKLQVKLADDNVNLTNSISDYEKQVEELEAYIEKLASIGLDYDEQIKAQQNQIKLFEDAGCKDGDSIDDCYYNKGGGSAYFSRPLNSGRVTQAWGNNGHKGIDLGGNAKGTAVYAPANGTVVHIAKKQSCGGNELFIHYSVNGKAYTTLMAHLTDINVSIGQKVTKGQVVATVGGDASTFYYDKCTTGAHLHYMVSYGYYLGGGADGYRTWSKLEANSTATSVQSITNLKNQKGWTWKNRG